MAVNYIKSIFDSPSKQYVPAPNTAFLPGERTLMWGVDKYHDAVTPEGVEVAYGEIVKITAFNDTGATVSGIVNADTAPNFAVVIKTENGAIGFPVVAGAKPYTNLPHLPHTIWTLGTLSNPATDQNDEVVVAYSGSSAVGTDLTGQAVYTPKLASDTNGVNGTATETSTDNLKTPLVFVGKVFAPTSDETKKCIRVRVGGKL